MIREFQSRFLHRTLKCGRHEPPAGKPKLYLKNYLRKLPTPPDAFDYTPAATAALNQMLLNDTLGDCVVAAGYHMEGVLTANAGKPAFIPTAAQVTADYSAIGGYVPGDPTTDQGCDERSAFKYWINHGFANGTKLAGWLVVDATSQAEYLFALWRFRNLFFGANLPNPWLDVHPGFVWDVGASNRRNGHAFAATGKGQNGVKVSTWGMVGTITHNAIRQVVSPHNGGELYVLLSPDIIDQAAKAGPGELDWVSLVSDWNSLGGNIKPPAPTPAPTVLGPGTYRLPGGGALILP